MLYGSGIFICTQGKGYAPHALQSKLSMSVIKDLVLEIVGSTAKILNLRFSAGFGLSLRRAMVCVLCGQEIFQKVETLAEDNQRRENILGRHDLDMRYI